jgi:hypothetical protein
LQLSLHLQRCYVFVGKCHYGIAGLTVLLGKQAGVGTIELPGKGLPGCYCQLPCRKPKMIEMFKGTW